MKAAIVFFSLDGNTAHAAGKLGQMLNADLFQLIPEKKYPDNTFSKYFFCGMSAVLGKAPNLTPYRFDPTLYDLIILGTPVWAGTFAPPLRTFLRANSLAGKHVALFACCSGGNAEKCFADMKKEVGNCTPLSTLRLIDPLKKNQADAAGSLAEFCTNLKPYQAQPAE